MFGIILWREFRHTRGKRENKDCCMLGREGLTLRHGTGNTQSDCAGSHFNDIQWQHQHFFWGVHWGGKCVCIGGQNPIIWPKNGSFMPFSSKVGLVGVGEEAPTGGAATAYIKHILMSPLKKQTGKQTQGWWFWDSAQTCSILVWVQLPLNRVCWFLLDVGLYTKQYILRL